MAKKGELKKVVTSLESAKKLGNIPNIDVYIVNTLNNAIEFIKSKEKDNYLYVRNIKKVKCLPIDNLNVLDIMNHKNLILSEESIKYLEKKYN